VRCHPGSEARQPRLRLRADSGTLSCGNTTVTVRVDSARSGAVQRIVRSRAARRESVAENPASGSASAPGAGRHRRAGRAETCRLVHSGLAYRTPREVAATH
jgi:hypothetical protein